MAKPEWGIKHECPNCSVRFYDLQKPSPVTCPSCEFEFATDVLHRIKKVKPAQASSDQDADDINDEELEDDIELEEDSDNLDADDLLLQDDDDEDDTVGGDGADGADVESLSEDMFPDDGDDDAGEELPEDLLEDDIDEEEKDK